MNARLPILLAVLSTDCGSAATQAPDSSADAEPNGIAEPRPIPEPPPITAPHCPGPRYRLHLELDPPTIEPVDGAPALDHERVSPIFEGDLDGDDISDAIVDLGLCGNWGDCIHAVLLGCDGQGLFSLASEPGHYAQSFAVEPSAEGPPTLWELVRGEMERADEITRVRWEVRERRAGPASLWEGPDACTPTVRDAVFVPSGTGFDLTVFGSGFCPRAMPLIARVGEQEVIRIVLVSSADRFSGTLVTAPNPGDRLFVGWADEPLRETEIAFGAHLSSAGTDE